MFNKLSLLSSNLSQELFELLPDLLQDCYFGLSVAEMTVWAMIISILLASRKA